MSVDHERRLLERVPVRRESIRPLRCAVVGFARSCGASDEQCEDVALAVSEALSNTVEHAYVGLDTPGSVEVEASLRERSLVVVVSDNRIARRARDGPAMAMSLRLIFELTERFEFENTRSGTWARMTFVIG
jgi:anti-sigma regulatory factor (Ser/Thr protein kinase)